MEPLSCKKNFILFRFSIHQVTIRVEVLAFELLPLLSCAMMELCSCFFADWC